MQDVYRGVTVAFLLRYSDGQFSTVLSCFVLLSQIIFEFSDKEREREREREQEQERERDEKVNQEIEKENKRNL